MKHLFNIFHRNHVVSETKCKTEEITDARKEYLNFCETEAKSIYRKLSIEVLNELETSTTAYIHTVGEYVNIKVNLFNSIGWIEAFNK